jgi:large subunit ribosomal protein L21e
MGRRKGGLKRKTRSLMTKPVRAKGKISLTAYFAKYSPGDRVVLKTEPAVQKGTYFLRFHGRVATVLGKRGDCYELDVPDGGKRKLVIVHPVHLRRTQ